MLGNCKEMLEVVVVFWRDEWNRRCMGVDVDEAAVHIVGWCLMLRSAERNGVD